MEARLPEQLAFYVADERVGYESLEWESGTSVATPDRAMRFTKLNKRAEQSQRKA